MSRSIKRKISLYLEELGDSPEQVAGNLLTNDCRGGHAVSSCPIAIYIKKSLGWRIDSLRVSVTSMHIIIYAEDYAYRMKKLAVLQTPEALGRFICAYDRHELFMELDANYRTEG